MIDDAPPHDHVPAVVDAAPDVLPAAPRWGERITAVAAVVVLALDLAAVAVHEPPPAEGLPPVEALPDDLEVPDAVSDRARERAEAAAGCELLVDGEPFADRSHVDLADAPPAAVLYPEHRPAHSGRHVGSVIEVPDRIPAEPIEERVVVHNLEHGSVVVWFDQARATMGELEQMQRWMRERRALGFESRVAGGVFVSPAPTIDSGKAVAIRAWGVALDCDRFDVTVADAFLQAHWGSNGASPEAHLSPFPAGVLGEVGGAV